MPSRGWIDNGPGRLAPLTCYKPTSRLPVRWTHTGTPGTCVWRCISSSSICDTPSLIDLRRIRILLFGWAAVTRGQWRTLWGVRGRAQPGRLRRLSSNLPPNVSQRWDHQTGWATMCNPPPITAVSTMVPDELMGCRVTSVLG